MELEMLDKINPGKSIYDYMLKYGGIYTDGIVVLKSRKITNFFLKIDLLDERDEDTDYYEHEDFLWDIGILIGQHAERLGATMLLGIETVGATLAEYAEKASGITACYVDFGSDDDPIPDDGIVGEKVLIIGDVTRKGKLIGDTVAICNSIGAEVAGALTMIRCDTAICEAEVGLELEGQEFVSLLDLKTKIIYEEADEQSELLKAGLPVRLDVGYAVEYGWQKEHPEIEPIGEPKDVMKDVMKEE